MSTENQAFEAGQAAWKELDQTCDILEYPAENPFGDEYQNPIAKAFRRGFRNAARADGYTYSSITGEFQEDGDLETDEFPELEDEA